MPSRARHDSRHRYPSGCAQLIPARFHWVELRVHYSYMAVSCQPSARSAFTPSSSPPWPGPGPADPRAMNARIKAIISEAWFGCYDNSSGGGSSRASSVHSDSDESSSADEFWHNLREVRRHASPLSSSIRDSIRRISVSSPRALDDDVKHQQRMLLVLPAFASPATAAARAEALTRWLAGFDVGWVVGASASLPRREVARKVREWAQALSTMERLFLLWKPEVAAETSATALGELAAASAGAMLNLVRAVSALESSPSKLLTALDVYAPVWETYPVLARLFSWAPSHPVLAAAETALADLVDAARRCRRDLGAFIRSHYPWQMPQGGEVHPCVGFWMGYFRCMLRHRVSLYFVLGGNDDDQRVAEAAAPRREQGAEEGAGLSRLVAELVSCLEAVLEEKSAALAAPGLRHVFMLNNTCAVVLHAVGSDLKLFLPPGWVHDHEERMEGYVKGYVAASWAPVVSRLADGGGRRARPSSVIVSGRQNRLNAFRSALESACSAQRCWKVPNPVLRGVLRKNVSEKVVPVYRRFLEDHPEVQVATGLAAEELEQQLLDLFEG